MNDFFTNFYSWYGDALDELNKAPMYYTTLYTSYPTETKEVVNATVDTPLAFNLITDTDKDITLELGMAGVKKENLKISRKGRTFTITCVGVGVVNNNGDKKIGYIKKGLKVPSDKDVVSTFVVPDTFDVEKVKFTYENGLLTVVVPIRDEEKSVDVEF